MYLSKLIRIDKLNDAIDMTMLFGTIVKRFNITPEIIVSGL